MTFYAKKPDELPPLGAKDYDWRGLAPADLEAAKRFWLKRVNFFIGQLPRELAENKSSRILYVGCAFGALQRVWVDLGFGAVTGIEWDAPRAVLAKEYGCEVLIADYRQLPFPDRYFDVAVFDRVIQTELNYADPRDLQDIFRVCRDRAAIFFLFHLSWGPGDVKSLEGLGWNVHWGIQEQGLVHLTLYRGCTLDAPASRNPWRWMVARTRRRLQTLLKR